MTAADLLHDLECASAAYAALIERATREEATRLRREWEGYRIRRLVELGLSSPKGGKR